MKRVMILGGPGSGKSTLARRLHAIAGLPLFHLDQLHWRPGWVAPPHEVWAEIVGGIAGSEEWIMEGGYGKTFHLRMPRADTILWLDLPRRVSFLRVLKRMAVQFGRVRNDAAPGCPERFDLEFLSYAWTFKRKHELKYRLALAEYAAHANVHVFATSREVGTFLRDLSR
jgi:adenylate kinase family enzyme